MPHALLDKKTEVAHPQVVDESIGHCCRDSDAEKLAFADGMLQLNDQADDTACWAACDANSAHFFAPTRACPRSAGRMFVS